MSGRPRLAAFPKAFMKPLCVTGEMTLRQWVELAATLGIEGLEFYFGFIDLKDPNRWPEARRIVEDHGMVVPMLCCSPDFTHPDEGFRREQIDLERRMIDLTVALGGQYCRVLSGQRRPEVSREEGIHYAVQCIEECIAHAAGTGVKLVIENHYKDDFWLYPEFAQKADVFCELVDRIQHPYFGVNYDPSNAFIAGDDPLELLERVKHRVVTMHASDRYLIDGTLEDLRREESGSEGYVRRLRHGTIGRGLNNYDAIFSTLRGVGFNGWISLEDGVDGPEQLAESARFVRAKIEQHWPAKTP